MSGNAASPIGFVLATRWEASPIVSAFGFKRAGRGFYKSERNGRSLLLTISGVGLEPARRAAHQLCDAGAKELVSAGYCGALSPELNVGDVITDRLATSPHAVWSRAERVALAEKAGAQAVDMETQAIIEAGTRRGVPIRIVRVVSDRLCDDVSPLLGQDTPFSPLRIALRVLNPTRWPYVYKMWRQSRMANQRLIQAIDTYLKQKS